LGCYPNSSPSRMKICSSSRLPLRPRPYPCKAHSTTSFSLPPSSHLSYHSQQPLRSGRHQPKSFLCSRFPQTYSRKTLSAYRLWGAKFQAFVRSRPTGELGGQEVRGFLSDLAVRHGVAGSTQNQAFNALQFFYRHVLGREFGQIDGVVRAKRHRYVPVVLSRSEVEASYKNAGREFIWQGCFQSRSHLVRVRRSATQSHLKVTSKRVDSQGMGTPKPPTCDPKATFRPGECAMIARRQTESGRWATGNNLDQPEAP
jgi:hypothetical protein